MSTSGCCEKRHKTDGRKVQKERRNESAICIHFCRLLASSHSSEVIQKENAREVIFYESIKAIKASVGYH